MPEFAGMTETEWVPSVQFDPLAAQEKGAPPMTTVVSLWGVGVHACRSVVGCTTYLL